MSDASGVPQRQKAEHMGSSRVFLRVALGIAVLFFYCSPLLANSVSYSLNAPNTQLSSSPGPYGTVRLSLNDSGTISVVVIMATNFGIAGGGPAFGLNGSHVATRVAADTAASNMSSVARLPVATRQHPFPLSWAHPAASPV